MHLMSFPRSACVLVLALALSACGLSKPEVARVGDQDVNDSDLRKAVAVQQVLADLSGAPCGGKTTAGESQESACNRIALSGELQWLAVADFADTNGLTAAEKDVESAISGLETQVGADVLGKALGAHEVTRADLFELGRRILTVRAVRIAVAEKQVGTAAVLSQYERSTAQFTTVQADHILVKTEAEAQNVYQRVQDATVEQFMALARKVSIEPGAKDSGGVLGSAPASQYVPEFADAVVALEPGEISKPVHTQFGWHVIYLVDKQVTPFEQAKAGLLEPVAAAEFKKWLNDRAKELHVEVNPRYGRFEPDTFSVSAVRSTDPEGDAASPTP
jgi:parvulin-like peptidyl-prolyl cis-trans isomerase-like protein